MNRPLPARSSAGVVFVLLAALSLTFANVSAPLVYRAGGNPETILVLRNAGFVLLCGFWLRARGRFDWLDRRRRWICLGAGGAYTLAPAVCSGPSPTCRSAWRSWCSSPFR